MSYNVTAFKIKKKVNLTIPFSAFMEIEGVEIRAKEGGNVVISGLSEHNMTGKIDGENIVMNDMYYGGEFSGTMYEYLMSLFRKSQGEFEAIVIWEGGDQVTRLSVNNGNVDHEILDAF